MSDIQILATLPAFQCLMASIEMLSKLPTSFRRRVYEMAHNEAIKSRYLFRHKRLQQIIGALSDVLEREDHQHHLGVWGLETFLGEDMIFL